MADDEQGALCTSFLDRSVGAPEGLEQAVKPLRFKLEELRKFRIKRQGCLSRAWGPSGVNRRSVAGASRDTEVAPPVDLRGILV